MNNRSQRLRLTNDRDIELTTEGPEFSHFSTFSCCRICFRFRLFFDFDSNGFRRTFTVSSRVSYAFASGDHQQDVLNHPIIAAENIALDILAPLLDIRSEANADELIQMS